MPDAIAFVTWLFAMLWFCLGAWALVRARRQLALARHELAQRPVIVLVVPIAAAAARAAEEQRRRWSN